MKKLDKIINAWTKFRSPLGQPLSFDGVKLIYGRDVASRIRKDMDKIGYTVANKTSADKLRYAKTLVHRLEIFYMVKFIAITGSVATGNARESDDIDIFIVVRDHTSWIYRALLMLRTLTSPFLNRKNLQDKEDRFCINYIVEERALNFQRHDLFTLNEILQMIPVFNHDYYRNIPANNPWIYGQSEDSSESRTPTLREIPLIVLNIAAFVPQILYMLIANHHPDLRRLSKGLMRGEIALWPDDYHKKVKANRPVAG